jgi:predicted DNA-binding helix-hairpin-helix protein
MEGDGLDSYMRMFLYDVKYCLAKSHIDNVCVKLLPVDLFFWGHFLDFFKNHYCILQISGNIHKPPYTLIRLFVFTVREILQTT